MFSIHQILGLVSASLLIFTLGCNRMHPNPQEMDPIYRDLVSKTKEAESLVEDQKKKIEELKTELSATEVRTLERKLRKKDLTLAKRKLRQYEQQAHFFKIRSERRRVEGRKAYREAYNKGSDWPAPEEYQHYLTHQKLLVAPRQWDARVPKLFERSEKEGE